MISAVLGSRLVPVCISLWTSVSSVSLWWVLGLSRPHDSLTSFLVGGLAALGLALVPELLALGERDFTFYFPAAEVEAGGDERESLLLRLADELAQLFFMDEQLARAQRGVSGVSGIL